MDRRQFLQMSLLTPVAFGSVASAALASFGKSRIDWQTRLKDAHRLSVEQARPILIVFSAEWCTYCHKLIKETEGDKTLSGLIADRFIPCQLNFDRETKIAEVLKVEVLPTTIVLSPQVDLLLHKTGYHKPAAYRELLEGCLTKTPPVQQVTGARTP